MSDEHDERAARIWVRLKATMLDGWNLSLRDQYRIESALAAEFRADAEKVEKWKRTYEQNNETSGERYGIALRKLTSLRVENERLLESIRVRPLCEAGGCPHEIDADDLRAEVEQWRSGVIEIIKALGGEPPEIVSLNKVCELAAQVRAENEFLRNYQDSIRNGDRVIEERDQLRVRLEQAEKEVRRLKMVEAYVSRKL